MDHRLHTVKQWWVTNPSAIMPIQQSDQLHTLQPLATSKGTFQGGFTEIQQVAVTLQGRVRSGEVIVYTGTIAKATTCGGKQCHWNNLWPVPLVVLFAR